MTPVEKLAADSYAVIPLTQGKSAIIDVTSLPLVEGRKWCAVRVRDNWYAARARVRHRLVRLHSVILGWKLGDDWIADHINGDGLDNRRSNIRRCTRAENTRNAARHRDAACKYRGVKWSKRQTSKPWEARISVNGKRKYLGWYATEEDAAIAYDLAAIRYHGEFASTNIILREA